MGIGYMKEDSPVHIEEEVSEENEDDTQGMDHPTLEELRPNHLEIHEPEIEVWRSRKRRPSERRKQAATWHQICTDLKRGDQEKDN